jgi:hypothetical protein
MELAAAVAVADAGAAPGCAEAAHALKRLAAVDAGGGLGQLPRLKQIAGSRRASPRVS